MIFPVPLTVNLCRPSDTMLGSKWVLARREAKVIYARHRQAVWHSFGVVGSCVTDNANSHVNARFLVFPIASVGRPFQSGNESVV